MNQVTNRIPWKLFTEDEKKEFDFQNGLYEYLGEDNTWRISQKDVYGRVKPAVGDYVYRLFIDSEKWYSVKCPTMPDDEIKTMTSKGEFMLITDDFINRCVSIRPAKPSEITEPKRVFTNEAIYLVRLKGVIGNGDDVALYRDGLFKTIRHTNPLTANGLFPPEKFSWIGKELKITWPIDINDYQEYDLVTGDGVADRVQTGTIKYTEDDNIRRPTLK